jgi:hypothetical protein
MTEYFFSLIPSAAAAQYCCGGNFLSISVQPGRSGFLLQASPAF